MRIELSYSEILSGAMSGVMRQVENLKLDRSAAYGAGNKNDWQLHVEGALGEMAVAKHKGVYWYGKGGFRGDDVGKVQVRSTTHETGCLLIHPEDSDHDEFWLVTGYNGIYNVRGWIMGHAGKKQDFWREDTGRPAFFVPQSALNREQT